MKATTANFANYSQQFDGLVDQSRPQMFGINRPIALTKFWVDRPIAFTNFLG